MAMMPVPEPPDGGSAHMYRGIYGRGGGPSRTGRNRCGRGGPSSRSNSNSAIYQSAKWGNHPQSNTLQCGQGVNGDPVVSELMHGFHYASSYGNHRGGGPLLTAPRGSVGSTIELHSHPPTTSPQSPQPRLSQMSLPSEMISALCSTINNGNSSPRVDQLSSLRACNSLPNPPPSFQFIPPPQPNYAENHACMSSMKVGDGNPPSSSSNYFRTYARNSGTVNTNDNRESNVAGGGDGCNGTDRNYNGNSSNNNIAIQPHGGTLMLVASAAAAAAATAAVVADPKTSAFPSTTRPPTTATGNRCQRKRRNKKKAVNCPNPSQISVGGRSGDGGGASNNPSCSVNGTNGSAFHHHWDSGDPWNSEGWITTARKRTVVTGVDRIPKAEKNGEIETQGLDGNDAESCDQGRQHGSTDIIDYPDYGWSPLTNSDNIRTSADIIGSSQPLQRDTSAVNTVATLMTTGTLSSGAPLDDLCRAATRLIDQEQEREFAKALIMGAHPAVGDCTAHAPATAVAAAMVAQLIPQTSKSRLEIAAGPAQILVVPNGQPRHEGDRSGIDGPLLSNYQSTTPSSAAIPPVIQPPGGDDQLPYISDNQGRSSCHRSCCQGHHCTTDMSNRSRKTESSASIFNQQGVSSQDMVITGCTHANLHQEVGQAVGAAAEASSQQITVAAKRLENFAAVCQAFSLGAGRVYSTAPAAVQMTVAPDAFPPPHQQPAVRWQFRRRSQGSSLLANRPRTLGRPVADSSIIIQQAVWYSYPPRLDQMPRNIVLRLCHLLPPTEVCRKLRLLCRRIHEAVDHQWCITTLSFPSRLVLLRRTPPPCQRAGCICNSARRFFGRLNGGTATTASRGNKNSGSITEKPDSFQEPDNCHQGASPLPPNDSRSEGSAESPQERSLPIACISRVGAGGVPNIGSKLSSEILDRAWRRGLVVPCTVQSGLRPALRHTTGVRVAFEDDPILRAFEKGEWTYGITYEGCGRISRSARPVPTYVCPETWEVVVPRWLRCGLQNGQVNRLEWDATRYASRYAFQLDTDDETYIKIPWLDPVEDEARAQKSNFVPGDCPFRLLDFVRFWFQMGVMKQIKSVAIRSDVPWRMPRCPSLLAIDPSGPYGSCSTQSHPQGFKGFAPLPWDDPPNGSTMAHHACWLRWAKALTDDWARWKFEAMANETLELRGNAGFAALLTFTYIAKLQFPALSKLILDMDGGFASARILRGGASAISSSPSSRPSSAIIATNTSNRYRGVGPSSPVDTTIDQLMTGGAAGLVSAHRRRVGTRKIGTTRGDYIGSPADEREPILSPEVEDMLNLRMAVLSGYAATGPQFTRRARLRVFRWLAGNGNRLFPNVTELHVKGCFDEHVAWSLIRGIPKVKVFHIHTPKQGASGKTGGQDHALKWLRVLSRHPAGPPQVWPQLESISIVSGMYGSDILYPGPIKKHIEFTDGRHFQIQYPKWTLNTSKWQSSTQILPGTKEVHLADIFCNSLVPPIWLPGVPSISIDRHLLLRQPRWLLQLLSSPTGILPPHGNRARSTITTATVSVTCASPYGSRFLGNKAEAANYKNDNEEEGNLPLVSLTEGPAAANTSLSLPFPVASGLTSAASSSSHPSNVLSLDFSGTRPKDHSPPPFDLPAIYALSPRLPGTALKHVTIIQEDCLPQKRAETLAAWERLRHANPSFYPIRELRILTAKGGLISLDETSHNLADFREGSVDGSIEKIADSDCGMIEERHHRKSSMNRHAKFENVTSEGENASDSGSVFWTRESQDGDDICHQRWFPGRHGDNSRLRDRSRLDGGCHTRSSFTTPTTISKTTHSIGAVGGEALSVSGRSTESSAASYSGAVASDASASIGDNYEARKPDPECMAGKPSPPSHQVKATKSLGASGSIRRSISSSDLKEDATILNSAFD